MKKLGMVVSIALLSGMFVACKQNKPEFVVEKFFISFFNEDFEGIKDYVWEEHHSYYDTLEKYIPKGTAKNNVQVKDINCEIAGDTMALCSCMVQEDNEKEPERQVILLKKRNNQWLVDQGKEGPLPLMSSEPVQDFSSQVPEDTEGMEMPEEE